jgi:hypothetical protein
MPIPELTSIPGGALRAEGHDWELSVLRSAVRDWLVAEADFDTFDADVAAAGAWYGRGWWSDSYNGSMHECAGHPEVVNPTPGCPDNRPVMVVSRLAGVDEWPA